MEKVRSVRELNRPQPTPNPPSGQEDLCNAVALHKVTSDDRWQEMFLAQRRKGAKKTLRNAVALCVFAPLRENSSSHIAFFVRSRIFHPNS